MCNASRYKRTVNDDDNNETNKRKRNVNADQHKDITERKVPALAMWYLPMIDRLKRMFSNPRDAELLIWHDVVRRKDGKLRHPADARQWKTFDLKHPEFSDDPRNIRMAISTDGMNPFGEMRNPHIM